MATTKLWENTEAKAYYFLIKKTVQSGPSKAVEGVKSCSYFVFEDYYDTDVYRDEFVFPNGLGVVDNQQELLAGNYLTNTDGATETVVAITASHSGSDSLMHYPPRDTKKSRTMMFFWSGSVDASNVLFSAWVDELRSYSIEPFGNI